MLKINENNKNAFIKQLRREWKFMLSQLERYKPTAKEIVDGKKAAKRKNKSYRRSSDNFSPLLRQIDFKYLRRIPVGHVVKSYEHIFLSHSIKFKFLPIHCSL